MNIISLSCQTPIFPKSAAIRRKIERCGIQSFVFLRRGLGALDTGLRRYDTCYCEAA